MFALVLLASLFLPAPPLAAIAAMDDGGVVRHPMELGQAKAAVFIFVEVECPISNSYAPEINRIVADYSAKGINFYIVYPDPALTAEQVRQHAAAFGFHCPALMDGDRLLERLFHVEVTSEAVVVGKNGKVEYHGRIDNLYVDFGKKRYAATTHELRDALNAVVAGQPVATPVTKTVGCPI